MTDDIASAHYDVVAVRIELGTQDFNICDPAQPKPAEYFADEDVFDDAFTKY